METSGTVRLSKSGRKVSNVNCTYEREFADGLLRGVAENLLELWICLAHGFNSGDKLSIFQIQTL